jgi:uncharacterized protein (DUF1330 family)
MAAYVIAYLDITDPERFAEYRRAAGPTFEKYGGKPIVVDGRMQVLEGLIHPTSVVVVEFGSFEDATRWYGAEHASTIPLRRGSADSCLILVDGLPSAGPCGSDVGSTVSRDRLES